ncbi:MAG: phosphatidylserine/phosphatidylglycerophosphate/cardiolipin synthase family protein [Acidobacteria bacterium]|nr:phosphatidylserine/phosphatidylglycerophosphate/cardiolipin synthase family protein [Candidatus Sulfomarinibacter kjeldsenii]
MNGGRVFSRVVVYVLLTVSCCGFLHAGDEESLQELVTRVGRARWTFDNSIDLLADPRDAWQARVDLTESARHHVFISTFSWHNDTSGKDFRDILISSLKQRKAEEIDLDLRVLVDASALFAFTRMFASLEKTGARVRGFNRSTWGLTALWDGRMHDKLFIADGRKAILSGRNFSDDYYDFDNWWFDLGVELEGSAVDDLQMIFLKSWEFTEFNRAAGRFLLPQEELLHELQVFWRTGRFPNGKSPIEKFVNEEYFPGRTEAPGSVPVAILYDNPFMRRRAATTDLLVELAGRAKDRIDLMTPFPNFDPPLTDALISAMERGVKIRLFTNGREAAIRSGPFLLAGYPTLIRLIEAGAEVWAWRGISELLHEIEDEGCRPDLMPPSALHGKMMLLDDELSIIHSSNFNIRSTYYNTEAGVAVLDRGFNKELSDLLEDLIDFHDVEIDCGNGNGSPEIPELLSLLGREDIPEMQEELGGKQGFLDAWGVTW